MASLRAATGLPQRPPGRWAPTRHPGCDGLARADNELKAARMVGESA
jgi:hypothetical protein